MKKTIIKELIRFIITIGSAMLGSASLSGCASVIPVIF